MVITATFMVHEYAKKIITIKNILLLSGLCIYTIYTITSQIHSKHSITYWSKSCINYSQVNQDFRRFDGTFGTDDVLLSHFRQLPNVSITSTSSTKTAFFKTNIIDGSSSYVCWSEMCGLLTLQECLHCQFEKFH